MLQRDSLPSLETPQVSAAAALHTLKLEDCHELTAVTLDALPLRTLLTCQTAAAAIWAVRVFALPCWHASNTIAMLQLGLCAFLLCPVGMHLKPQPCAKLEDGLSTP